MYIYTAYNKMCSWMLNFYGMDEVPKLNESIIKRDGLDNRWVALCSIHEVCLCYIAISIL